MDKNFEDMGLIEMGKTLGEMGDELKAEKKKSRKCECRTSSWNSEGDTIEYCRLHECAEELLDALKHSHNMHHALLSKKCDGFCIAAQAIAKVEGK